MNFCSLPRRATCHEGPLSLRTGGGRSWQVLLYLHVSLSVLTTSVSSNGPAEAKQPVSVSVQQVGPLYPFCCATDTWQVILVVLIHILYPGAQNVGPICHNEDSLFCISVMANTISLGTYIIKIFDFRPCYTQVFSEYIRRLMFIIGHHSDVGCYQFDMLPFVLCTGNELTNTWFETLCKLHQFTKWCAPI